ncbi:helix-turn-helix domain-containing protein [Streptomyces broussonetiae]|uniref:Helix-turn-helix domain-containing protein n=1 Tax=Streptomyces broussonetiae TaxID=2686304 RepID=A0A6I6NG40_9ACTN|nr:helix-turn-helix domain-containing protein [Streptomyces broussonetiae]QHA09311.1 helix-turn-helix domain-containing protein [Streptomyces broussonetiae]
MNFQTGPIRDASRAGDYGRVIELIRKGRQMTQAALGQALGLSQSAVSRLEKRGSASYSTDVLTAAAAHLQIPPALVGLADGRMAQVQTRDDDPMHRRTVLGGAVAAMAAPVLAAVPDTHDTIGGQAAALRLTTSAYRRLDSTTPSRDLADAVDGHIRLIQTVTRSATSEADRARLAAAGSEAASFAGWLAWDKGDHGSARSWYGGAIKAARTSGNALLTAYQAGTLAQFEAHAGNGVEALNLARRARRVLGEQRPAVADAWLSSVEALGYAAAGDLARADRALTASRTGAEALTAAQEPPPWPWVFSFTPDKVAACRVTCGARLGLADWVLAEDVEALTTGHAKQRALLVLDIAAGHLASGRVEATFALASRALDIGLQYRSGRIVERVRAVRRSLTTTSPSKVVRDFDERLHGVYL